jgi:epoxyqueuosine reductase
MIRTGRSTHQPSPRAQRGFTRQSQCTSHAVIPPHHQHVTKITLVCSRLTRWQRKLLPAQTGNRGRIIRRGLHRAIIATMSESQNHPDWARLAADILQWGQELGFQKLGISDTQLDSAEAHLLNWLDEGRHGRMAYMAKHGTRRSRPAELEPGTVSVISARLDYLPGNGDDPQAILADPKKAYISRYALGRDYHKVLRNRIQKLATRIEQSIGAFGYRVFTDSAPVLEKALAEKAGLGWIGKHSNLLAEQTGSWFFLGEIYTDLPLPTSLPAGTKAINHCGTCTACIDACPTRAIVAPYKVDARLCISYLTIELRESIPVELRPLIGNRS